MVLFYVLYCRDHDAAAKAAPSQFFQCMCFVAQACVPNIKGACQHTLSQQCALTRTGVDLSCQPLNVTGALADHFPAQNRVPAQRMKGIMTLVASTAMLTPANQCRVLVPTPFDIRNGTLTTHALMARASDAGHAVWLTPWQPLLLSTVTGGSGMHRSCSDTGPMHGLAACTRT